MTQQCYKIGNSSAMDKICFSNVLRLGTAQQHNKTGHKSAVFQDWELFSNVIRRGIRQPCFKIGNCSEVDKQ